MYTHSGSWVVSIPTGVHAQWKLGSFLSERCKRTVEVRLILLRKVYTHSEVRLFLLRKVYAHSGSSVVFAPESVHAQWKLGSFCSERCTRTVESVWVVCALQWSVLTRAVRVYGSHVLAPVVQGRGIEKDGEGPAHVGGGEDEEEETIQHHGDVAPVSLLLHTYTTTTKMASVSAAYIVRWSHMSLDFLSTHNCIVILNVSALVNTAKAAPASTKDIGRESQMPLL